VFKHLRVKLTLFYAALFGGVLLAVALIVYAAAMGNAERLGRDQLAASGKTFDRLMAMRDESLRNDAQILSQDFGFRAAVATGDAPTVRSALANLGARFGLHRAYVVSLDGHVTAPDAALDASLPPDIVQAVTKTDDSASGMIQLDGKVYEAVVAPILAPSLTGWVVFARALGPADLLQLEQLSAIPVQAAVLGRNAAGAWRAYGLGHPLQVDARLSAMAAAAGQSRVETLRSPGQGPALVFAHRLASLGGGQDTLVLRYPMADALKPYTALFRQIVLVGLAAILLVILASWLIARTVTRPLFGLAQTARRIQAGDSAARVTVSGEDEIAAVSAAFNTMADAVAEREENLIQAKTRAEAADKVKSEFLANINHELRTPLNGLLEPARMLQATRLDDGQRRIADLIRTSAESLQRILNNVLELVELGGGAVDITPEDFDLGSLLRRVGAEAEWAAHQAGLSFALFGADDCGWVTGDGDRIAQVLASLLDNAVKFTATGEVVLTAEPTPAGWRFTVRDTGQGFAPDKAEGLFEAFRQADGSMTRGFGGVGVGLSIVRKLVRTMGGDVLAHGEPNVGAIFEVTIPLPTAQAPASVAAPPGTDQTAHVEAGAGEEAPLRILLAEDNPSNRTVVELILGAVGVDVAVAENGAEAVDAFKSGAFDLILMDLQMPVMDGLTAIRLIRQAEGASGGRTPIIVLSANVQAEHLQGSAAAGADRHIAKPIVAARLLGAIEDVLTQADGQESARAA
jgi:signal transduction histidine kinase/ActR/RegA family two-component response regulator